MEIVITGWATTKCSPRAVADLRQLVSYLNENGVEDDVAVEADMGNIWVTLTGEDSVPGEWIECGEHRPQEGKPWPKDILLPGHDCDYQPEKYNGPENYEEALEESLPPEPPSYQARASLTDWLLGGNDDWRVAEPPSSQATASPGYHCWECKKEIPPKDHYGDSETLMFRCSDCRERGYEGDENWRGPDYAR